MRGWIEPYTTKAGEKRYTARWRTAAGEKRAKTFRRRGDADKWLTEQVVERDLDDPTLPPQLMGARLIEGYVDDLEHRQRLGAMSPSTVAAYKSNLRVHIAPWLRERRVDWLTRHDATTWARSLSEALDEGDMAPRSFNHILATFSALALGRARGAGSGSTWPSTSSGRPSGARSDRCWTSRSSARSWPRRRPRGCN